MLTILAISLMGQAVPGDDRPWWDDKVAASLDRCPERTAEWTRLMKDCPEPQRPGMAYLIADLPLRDLERLPTEVLAKNVALAYQARKEVRWGASLPEATFLDAVLPHVSLTEPRDPMRAEFHDRYLPLVKVLDRPGAAAHAINKALFKDYQVTYNTKRLRTDQNSKESIAQGMATCTGLSIMLVEACRAVGVPARVAGIASWPGRGGNHTWVEVWDDGWHFVGAAEPDEKGLDHAWFVGDAATAIADVPRNAIHAATYRRTGTTFPLAWSPSATVPAENVTERYTRGKVAAAPAKNKLYVEVTREGERIEADVSLVDRATGAVRSVGSSLGPQADINRHLTCEAPVGPDVFVMVRLNGQSAMMAATVAGETLVRLALGGPLDAATREALAKTLTDRFGADESRRELARKVLAELPWDESVREMAWAPYKDSPMHEALKTEFDEKTVKTVDRTSPYLWRHVGEKPKDGWALVIAMHGGGGAPKRVNDSQWNGMFEQYYKDHPEAGGYVYLALRAPNDEWNGFYDDAICPLVERLIRQCVLFGDVDPDRVFILGASHGGYGAFVIGPKMPDRFAAIHASASAPTPGETRGENLRDVRFTFMVGEKDTAYGRAERCQAFAKELEGWKDKYGGFPGGFEWKEGVGHSVPDRDKLAEMLTSGKREARPDRVVWVQSDDVLKHCYCVESIRPADSARIDASVRDNTVTLNTEGQDAVALWLDSPLVDLSRPLTIVRDGRPPEVRTMPRPSAETYCRGLELRGDPKLAAPVRVEVDNQK
jgi:poly(3-hydroxybutyrate) depolymerase